VPALIGILRQLAGLLASLTDEQYTRKPVGVVPSSIGGHVRHCLDHIDALLGGLPQGFLDYDARCRGTAVEQSRTAALEAMGRQEQQLLEFPWAAFPPVLRMSVLLTPDGSPVEVVTSLGRELAFVLSHTIHHNSLVSVMAKLMAVAVPADFGYAPSTIAHRDGKSCAR
jgi:uncharacterized damage-inducible protein DinB